MLSELLQLFAETVYQVHHNLPFEIFTERGYRYNHKENASHQASSNVDRKSISTFTGEEAMGAPVRNSPAVVLHCTFLESL